MNTYELTVLLPEGDEKVKEKVTKVITDFAKKHKGEIHKAESWGAKHLAYPIQKKLIAQYEHFVVSLPPSEQPTLDTMLRMDESVLRYMFVRV